MGDLDSVARELDAVLEGIKESRVAPLPTEVAGLPEEDQYDALARAAFDYVVSQIAEDIDPSSTGQALMLAAAGIAKDARVNPDKVQDAMLRQLAELLDGASGFASDES